MSKNTKKDFRSLEFGKVMESMTGEKLRERIQLGMNFKIPHDITPVPYLGKESELVEYAFDELVARCPVTGIKDHYKIIIRFVPQKWIPELKSLKLYFWDYEECFVPISHEHLAAKIYSYLREKLELDEGNLYIRLEVAGRGELFTTVRVGQVGYEDYKDRDYKNL